MLCKLTRSHDNTQMNSFLCVTCFSASAEECPAELGEEAGGQEKQEKRGEKSSSNEIKMTMLPDNLTVRCMFMFLSHVTRVTLPF